VFVGRRRASVARIAKAEGLMPPLAELTRRTIAVVDPSGDGRER